jgi:hypothetical protein
MRGFDYSLTTRVDRAKGDHYAFTPDTLRWFDAFGGRHVTPADALAFHVVAIVESTRDNGGAYGTPAAFDGRRTYRVRLVTFYTVPDEHGTPREHVTVDGVGPRYLSAAPVERYARELVARIASALSHVEPRADGYSPLSSDDDDTVRTIVRGELDGAELAS